MNNYPLYCLALVLLTSQIITAAPDKRPRRDADEVTKEDINPVKTEVNSPNYSLNNQEFVVHISDIK